MTRPRTTVYVAISVDGFVARPDGGVEWLEHDAGGQDYGYQAHMDSVDALVMGRGTFETVRGFGAWPYGDTPVHVLTRSLGPDDVPDFCRGHVHLSSESPGDLLAALAAQGVGHVYLDGGRLVQDCFRQGLVDTVILTRFPVLLGQGIRLFGPLAQDVPLEHVETTAFDTGLVQSTYRVLGVAAAG